MEEIQQQLQFLQQQNRELLQQLELQQQAQQQQPLSAPVPPSPAVHRVSVKLPQFWPDKPALWFAQVEAQFAVSGITADDTRYSYVVAQLDSRYAAEVEDIILSPPANDRYAYLKNELIRRLSISEEQRVRRLLGQEELVRQETVPVSTLHAVSRWLHSHTGRTSQDSVDASLASKCTGNPADAVRS